MRYTIFPESTKKVSTLGVGTWVHGAENWGGAEEFKSVMAIQDAVRAGMNFIDTAPFYGDGLAESIVGKAVKEYRDKVFIATKCGLVRRVRIPMIDLSPSSILREVDESLKRLQTHYIDLYQCHWPDKNIPVEKTMETLLKLQEQKKIRHIGVCNFTVELLERALKVAPISSCQVAYSLLDRSIEKELLPFCRQKGVGIIAYGSLGGGILSGKYQSPPQFGKFDARMMFYKFYKGQKFLDALNTVEVLKNFGHPLNQLALNWVRQQRGVVTALVGCRTSEQARDNAKAADWDLTPDELRSISELTI